MAVGRLVPREPVQPAADGGLRFGRAPVGPDPLFPLRVLPHRGDRLVQRIEKEPLAIRIVGEQRVLARRAAVQHEHDAQRQQQQKGDAGVGQVLQAAAVAVVLGGVLVGRRRWKRN